ncbi:MAG: redoxin domain-containing protein [bacterium]
MNVPFMHPNEDVLADYLVSALSAKERESVSNHLASCVSCQQTLRFLGDVGRTLATSAPSVSPDVLTRALAARDAGERRILPSPERALSATQTSSRRRLSAWMAIAASIVVIVLAVVARPNDVSAVGANSEMHILPARPHQGDTVHVRYRPGAGLFAGDEQLVVRARFRMRGDAMYGSSVPVNRVRQAALLRRSANGELTGSFVLPRDIDFVSMVVEDTAAHHVDENGGRLWEVLTYGADEKPTFSALEQRMNDMMGRSWQEGYATARRLAELYPQRYDSWSVREFFERALFGESAADSLSMVYGRRGDALIADAKARSALSSEEIGAIFFSRRTRMLSKGATTADSAEFRYWLKRISREYPRHMQLPQHFASELVRADSKRPEAVLDSLEHLYSAFAPLSGTGRYLLIEATHLAAKTTSDELFLRWQRRSAAFESPDDGAYQMALGMARRPSLRQASIASIRALLANGDSVVTARQLTENRSEYQRRRADARRTLFATLGRQLIADGRVREGLDTLGIAANGAWDLELFNSLYAAYVAAGDTAKAQAMRIRMAIDPRTDTAAAIVAAERERLGTQRWDSLSTAARSDMYSLILARAAVRPLHGAPSMVTADGTSHALRDLTAGAPTAVIFWSRNCGFALEALPAIERVAARMTKEGKRLLLVVDEAPSAEVRTFLADKKWTLPIYYDARGEMSAAFTNFGTPAYYVLDGAGRIRFDHVSEAAELIAQMDALSSESTVVVRQ